MWKEDGGWIDDKEAEVRGREHTRTSVAKRPNTRSILTSQ